MMFKKFFSAGLALAVGAISSTYAALPPRQQQASVFADNTAKPSFRYTHVEKSLGGGKLAIEGKYRDLTGKVALTERVVLGPQAELLDYAFEQKQKGERGGVKRIRGLAGQPDRVRLSYTGPGKPTQTTETEAPPNLVVGPSLVPYLMKHGKQIMAGGELEVRMAVPERQDTYGFSLKNRGRDNWQGNQVIRVEMQATSWLIRQFVSAMSFYMDSAGREFLGYKGLLSVFTRGSDQQAWQPLTGKTVYLSQLGSTVTRRPR